MFIKPIDVINEINLPVNGITIDLGAGIGEYSLEIAKKISSHSGLVYAVDIQQNVLTRLSHTAKDLNLNNIHYIHADVEKINGVQLKSDTGNLVIISNVLFTSDFKEDMLKEACRLTCEGGQLLVIDWKDSHRKFGPDKNSTFSEDDCLKLVLKFGFTLDKVIFAGSHHFALLFHKNISNNY